MVRWMESGNGHEPSRPPGTPGPEAAGLEVGAAQLAAQQRGGGLVGARPVHHLMLSPAELFAYDAAAVVALLDRHLCRGRPGMARLAVDCAAYRGVGRAQLHGSDYRDERGADGDLSPLDPRDDRAGFVAGARTGGADAGPAAQYVAGGDDTIHAVARANLGRGDQRRVPARRQPYTADTVRYLPAGDHRCSPSAAIVADRAGCRPDAGDLACRAAGLPRALQRFSDRLCSHLPIGR